MTDFPTLWYTLTSEIPTLYQAWQRYPSTTFERSRQYLPHGGSNSKWLHKLVQLRWNDNNNNNKSYAYDSVAVKPLKMKLTFY